jgi:hypothetical protein
LQVCHHAQRVTRCARIYRQPAAATTGFSRFARLIDNHIAHHADKKSEFLPQSRKS